MPPIRVLDISGTSFEMGHRHGTIHADAIRAIAEERIHLSTTAMWTGRTFTRADVFATADACLQAHWDYAPHLMEEIEGIAAATGLSQAELIVANGFTDFVDTLYNIGAGTPLEMQRRAANECTTMLVPNASSADGHGFLAQTWDMHATATPHVLLMRGQPVNRPDFLAFSITGCLGMIGMNEAGIAVGINNLVTDDGQIGVTWPFVCRKILEQTDLDTALDCILSAPLAGAHNYQIMDAEGNGYNIEATPTTCAVMPLGERALAHANRCMAPATRAIEREEDEDDVLDSAARVRRADLLLRRDDITPEHMMSITRDRSDGRYSICAVSEPPYYSETCCAAVMRPATGDFWGVWGLPTENAYEHFRL